MKILTLTVGLPHSGKSSWSKFQKCPIVNPDSIRLALHGQAFAPQAGNQVRSIAYTMTEALFLAGHDRVIIDATNTTKKRRIAWEKRFPDCKLELQVFDANEELCIIRAKNAHREDLIPIIKSMNKLAEWPETISEERIVCPSCLSKGSRGEVTTLFAEGNYRPDKCKCHICGLIDDKKLFTNGKLIK